MNRITALIQDFIADQQGATAVEYGLVAGLISMAIVAGATLIGQTLRGFFEAVLDGLTP